MSDKAVPTKGELLSIQTSLQSFDKPEPTIIDGKANVQPYDISEKATYAIIRNLRKLKSPMQDIADSRDALALAYNPHKLETKDIPEETVRKWETAHRALMRESAEAITWHVVDLSEFNVMKNKTMPRSVIANLIGTVINDNAPQDGVPKE